MRIQEGNYWRQQGKSRNTVGNVELRLEQQCGDSQSGREVGGGGSGQGGISGDRKRLDFGC